MMRKVLHRRHPRMEPGFNLTPMLDMVFYLLFFFIMATKMRDDLEQRLDVRLPSARSAQAVPAAATPSLLMTPDGRILYQNRPIELPELNSELHRLALQGQHEIAIRADERINYGRIIKVMDWCKLAGMKSVLLELARSESGPTTPRE